MHPPVGTHPAQVYALVDQNGDGKADLMTIMLPYVYWPNGIAWRNGSLYISGFYNNTASGELSGFIAR